MGHKNKKKLPAEADKKLNKLKKLTGFYDLRNFILANKRKNEINTKGTYKFIFNKIL